MPTVLAKYFRLSTKYLQPILLAQSSNATLSIMGKTEPFNVFQTYSVLTYVYTFAYVLVLIGAIASPFSLPIKIAYSQVHHLHEV